MEFTTLFLRYLHAGIYMLKYKYTYYFMIIYIVLRKIAYQKKYIYAVKLKYYIDTKNMSAISMRIITLYRQIF